MTTQKVNQRKYGVSCQGRDGVGGQGSMVKEARIFGKKCYKLEWAYSKGRLSKYLASAGLKRVRIKEYMNE